MNMVEGSLQVRPSGSGGRTLGDEGPKLDSKSATKEAAIGRDVIVRHEYGTELPYQFVKRPSIGGKV